MTIKTKLLTYLADIELTATTKSKLEADITSSICKNLREDPALRNPLTQTTGVSLYLVTDSEIPPILPPHDGVGFEMALV